MIGDVAIYIIDTPHRHYHHDHQDRIDGRRSFDAGLAALKKSEVDLCDVPLPINEHLAYFIR